MNKAGSSIQVLSIIIPVYNEASTIHQVLENVCAVNLMDGISKEIIVINDGSTDKSADIIKKYISNSGAPVKYVSNPVNKGKGASVAEGIKLATGDFVVIQDADLEYNPEEFNILLEPVVQGFADVVYGSRFLGGKAHRILFFWHSLGNKFLTFLSNMFTNLNLTDMETCYKMMRTSMVKSLRIREKRFGFEPEITARLAKIPDIRIYEVGISYYGRKFKEGKKINWKDGLRAIFCILRYNLFA
jgi:glycosyltransferase involved in cell wall biosynthesis